MEMRRVCIVIVLAILIAPYVAEFRNGYQQEIHEWQHSYDEHNIEMMELASAAKKNQ
jgi:hypothetical protein